MSLHPGVRLGPYEITALLGEGGMSKVWRARLTGAGRVAEADPAYSANGGRVPSSGPAAPAMALLDPRSPIPDPGLRDLES